jgi:putative transposase
MRTSGQSVQVSNMELHGYNLNGISRHRESFQQLHHKSGRKLGLDEANAPVQGSGCSFWRDPHHVPDACHRARRQCRVLSAFAPSGGSGTLPAHCGDWNGMRCSVRGSAAIRERPERTTQGYRRYRCGTCGKQFNERSTGVLNRVQYPSDVIALVVLWRLRYKLSLRDLAEMFLTRGFIFSYEAVRDWEAKLTPTLAENLRRRRKGRVGPSWYIDETYIRMRGRWRYLYRAIDRDGALVDVRLSEHRELAAARAFFRSAKAVTGVTPDRVITDGHDAYPRAIRTELGQHVRHRTSRYLNNRLEQDHRGIKSRCRPMRGMMSPVSAAHYCRGYDELRNFLRY